MDSPLYASPTAYGYAKIGEHKMKSSVATAGVISQLFIYHIVTYDIPCRAPRVEAELDHLRLRF